MSFFTFDQGSAISADATGSIETGVYDVTIDTVSAREASTGTIGVDYSFVLEDGRKAIVYGSWIRKKSGETLIDGDKLNALMGLVGAKTLTEYNKEIEVKDGKKMVRAMKELDGQKIKVALFKEHDVYNGEERTNLKIHSFFSTKGFSYSEIVSGAKEPKKLKYVEANLKDSYTKRYKEMQAIGSTVDTNEPAESLL